jgi:hypothetical protein
VVKISGAQGQRLAVDLAQANNDNNSADTLGVVTETIAPNQEGFIMTVGQLENINTTGSLQGETWTDGDVLYLSPTVAGRMTNVKPTGATGHIVILGYVEYAHANNGKIYVKIMNGWELDELHNVYINTGTLANNDALIYESSTQLWKNKTIATALGFTPENVANKQNSLAVDGTGAKYPTVDAVNTSLNSFGGKIIAADYTDVAFTASQTAERIIRTLFIPKGTVPIGRTLKLSALVSKTGTASITGLRIRVGTSASPSPLSSAPTIAAAFNIPAANTFFPFGRDFIHTQSATSTLSIATNSTNDLTQGTFANNSFNWDNVDYWLILTCEHNTTSADAYTSHELILSL